MYGEGLEGRWELVARGIYGYAMLCFGGEVVAREWVGCIWGYSEEFLVCWVFGGSSLSQPADLFLY